MNDKGKAIFAWLYAVGVAVVPLIDGGRTPTPAEWVSTAIAVATAVSVYFTPLIPQAPAVKTGIAVLLAGLQAFYLVADDWSLTGSEWLTVAFAVAGALGVAVAPATSANGTHVGWGRDRYALAG